MTKELEAKTEDISKLLYEVYDVPSGICEYIDKALQRIDNAKKDINSLYSNMHQTSDELDKSLKDSLLKNAKIEAINNSNSNEALKCLERTREFLLHRTNEMSFQDLRIIEQALIQAKIDKKQLELYIQENTKLFSNLVDKSKKELAWEIVKEKEVDVHLLKACITCYIDSLNAYNSEIKKLHSNHKDYQNKPLSFYLLTKEEFDLLKEMLKNE